MRLGVRTPECVAVCNSIVLATPRVCSGPWPLPLQYRVWSGIHGAVMLKLLQCTPTSWIQRVILAMDILMVLLQSRRHLDIGWFRAVFKYIFLNMAS